MTKTFVPCGTAAKMGAQISLKLEHCRYFIDTEMLLEVMHGRRVETHLAVRVAAQTALFAEETPQSVGSVRMSRSGKAIVIRIPRQPDRVISTNEMVRLLKGESVTACISEVSR
ncbi:MAG: hypothetical protein WC683_05145 [bacterium]